MWPFIDLMIMSTLTYPGLGLAVVSKFLPSFRTMGKNVTNDLVPWGDIAVYAYGLTVAELKTSRIDGSVIGCKLTELQDPQECDTLVKKIGRPVINVCFERSLDIIKKCRSLVETPNNTAVFISPNQLPFWNQVWNGIFPGTKWCGSGDIANSYDDLGVDASLDKCCRAHDICPIKLKAFRRGHGLVNFSLYTKSHCECDEDFRQCLLQSKSDSALAIGNMYFNVLKVPCLKEVDEKAKFCKSSEADLSKECLHEDQRVVPMKFANTEHAFPLAGLNSSKSPLNNY